MERDIFHEPEPKVLLRTADVYQTEAADDVRTYSDRLLSLVAEFKNSGIPEATNAQSMVGKSKRGEVACRLFASINPATGIVEAAGFKARGCLAMTGCASAACQMIEGMAVEDVLAIGLEAISEAVDGVPADKIHALHFSVCALKGLVGDFLIGDDMGSAEVSQAVGCDPDSVSCLMAEHCSYRQTLLDLSMAEEEAREQAEIETACAQCFDRVRQRTAAGKLTTPADWEDLVPEAMMPDEFTDYILNSLDNSLESEGLDGASIEKPAAAKPSEFASRSVGVPSLFAPGPSAEESPESQAAVQSSTEAESSELAEENTVPAALVGTKTAYDYSHRRVTTEEDDDLDLIPPEGYKLVQVDGVWGLVETDEAPEQPARQADPTGICRLEGSEVPYLYDSTAMTSAYARWSFLAAEKDPLRAFAYCVREESRIYPRPMALSSLGNEPLSLDPATVEDLWSQAQNTSGHEDLCRLEASNGDVYFYSTNHLSQAHAQSLAEWESVERLWNV